MFHLWKRFISTIAVRNHCESIDFTGMFKNNCSVCQKRLSSKSSFNYHVSVYHNKTKMLSSTYHVAAKRTWIVNVVRLLKLWVPRHCFLNPWSQRQDGHSDLGHPLWPVDAQADQRVQEEDHCWEQGTQVEREIFGFTQFFNQFLWKVWDQGLSGEAWQRDCWRGVQGNPCWGWKLPLGWFWQTHSINRRLNTALGSCLITAGEFS